MPGRRKAGDENVRSLTKTSNGSSYAVTLPKAVIREFGWKERQKLELEIDRKKKNNKNQRLEEVVYAASIYGD